MQARLAPPTAPADARERAVARLAALADEEDAVRAALAAADSVSGDDNDDDDGPPSPRRARRAPAPDVEAWSDEEEGVKTEPQVRVKSEPQVRVKSEPGSSRASPYTRGRDDATARALQRALLAERLAGLAARRSALEAALKHEDGGAPVGGGGGGGSGRVDAAHAPTPTPAPDGALEAALAAAAGAGGGDTGLVETERDRLIRVGVLTPFDAVGGVERRVAAAPSDAATVRLAAALAAADAAKPRSSLLPPSALPPRERVARVDPRLWRRAASGAAERAGGRAALPARPARTSLPRAVGGRRAKRRRGAAAEVDAVAEATRRAVGEEGGEGDGDDAAAASSPSSSCSSDSDVEADVDAVYDDAHEATYLARVAAAVWPDGATRVAPRAGPPPHPTDAAFDGGFRVPGCVWSRLFPYQRTGVKWLWELRSLRVGGVVGDEMGLGKTVQLAAYLAGLVSSSRASRPALIVAPATLLTQWVRELRRWVPSARVLLLHTSAATAPGAPARPARAALLALAAASPASIVVTSYEGLRRGRGDVLAVRWGCAVLDEGHRIRSPDADVTLAAKCLATVHRIVLTGTPVQNKLAELW